MNKHKNFIKTLWFLAAFIASSVLLNSCDKDDDKDNGSKNITLTAGATSQSVYADQTQGKSAITFTTTGAWISSIVESSVAQVQLGNPGGKQQAAVAAVSPDWISITPKSGNIAGTYTINIALETNYTGEDRSASIIITSGGDDIEISINQESVTINNQVPVMPVPVTSITLNKSTLSLAVNANETLTATVLPNNATSKSVTWTSSHPAVASVTNGTILAIAAGTATITAKAGDKTATCTVTVTAAGGINPADGVVINGVTWATRNVDNPGTFAATPESAGKFYQWNREKAWSATGEVTGWDNSAPIGDSWEVFNDPSPVGWRVPTYEEILKLLDTDKVGSERTTLNGVGGWKFTDLATKASFFLPAVGYRRYTDDGLLEDVGLSGGYWSSTQGNDWEDMYAYSLTFGSGRADWLYNERANGRSLRCVAK